MGKIIRFGNLGVELILIIVIIGVEFFFLSGIRDVFNNLV